MMKENKEKQQIITSEKLKPANGWHFCLINNYYQKC